jgi:tellurite resistance protein TerC
MRDIGIEKFFMSAEADLWFGFVGVLILFLLVQSQVQEGPHKRRLHGLAIFIWLAMAAACNMFVWYQWGSNAALGWFNGYLLEFVFSIENVFVFHVVVRAFRVPRRHTQRALTIVIYAQILFEMLFFMGLAPMIMSSHALPYVLGLWLLYVGYQAGFEKARDVHFEDTWVYQGSKWLLGPRLTTRYRKNDLSLISFDDSGMKVSLLFLATMCLIVVDFCLEVDVVLTKIEDMQNHFVAFTSSVAAAFAVPDLFFILKDLFERYYLLKFGICFILVFFGIQMLAHAIVTVPTLLQIMMVVAAMVVCVALSVMLPAKDSKLLLDIDEESEVQTSESN